MFKQPVLVIAFAVLVSSALADPAASQGAPTKSAKSAQVIDLDPGPESSGPDPLTPPEVNAPPPSAPGAPTAAVEAKPVEETDPVVLAVRQRLAKPPARVSAGEREDYAALAAFYATASEPVWTAAGAFTQRGTQAIGEIRKADGWGLKASAFDLPAVPEGSATADVRADAEIKLGFAVLKYARHARGGRLDPPSVSRMFDQKPTIYDPKSLMQAVAVNAAVDAYLRDLHPKHPQFIKLREALLAARGGATAEVAQPPPVKVPAGPSVKPGQDHPHVALVRQRLSVDTSPGKESIYDDTLVSAVKTYQRLRNLEATGTINGATRAALNDTGRPSTSGDNVRRLIVNMERWRWMPENLGAFYVWDSVPEQITAVVQDGKVLFKEKIVVGKINTPTPVFSADMLLVIFHPSWGVPPGMKSQELGPQLRNTGGGWFSTAPLASTVLAGHGLRVSYGGRPIDPDSVNWSSVDIRSFDFTQPPGPRNVLGIVKFRFPNKHDVYMHDTPERHLFGGAVRAFSHGCMRVQNPVRLAEVLLQRDKGWSTDKVAEYVRSGGEIKLTTPIPVHVTYFTAVADDDGKVEYRADLYGLDSRVATALEGQAVNVVSAAAPAAEAGETEPRPERPRQVVRKKAAQSESFNPFAAIFGN